MFGQFTFQKVPPGKSDANLHNEAIDNVIAKLTEQRNKLEEARENQHLQ